MKTVTKRNGKQYTVRTAANAAHLESLASMGRERLESMAAEVKAKLGGWECEWADRWYFTSILADLRTAWLLAA